jgi:hypothetical protein
MSSSISRQGSHYYCCDYLELELSMNCYEEVIPFLLSKETTLLVGLLFAVP